MKCKRCGTTMTRSQIKEHSFGYECPKCHLRIEAKKTQTSHENKEEEASPSPSPIEE